MNEMVKLAIAFLSTTALCLFAFRLSAPLNRWLVDAVWWVVQVYVRKKCFFHRTRGRRDQPYRPGEKTQVSGDDLDYYGCTFDARTFPMYQPVITEVPRSSPAGMRVAGHIWPSCTLAELELRLMVMRLRSSRYVNFYTCIYNSIPNKTTHSLTDE